MFDIFKIFIHNFLFSRTTSFVNIAITVVVGTESHCWSNRLSMRSYQLLLFIIFIWWRWMLILEFHYVSIIINFRILNHIWITKNFFTFLIKGIIKILNIRFLIVLQVRLNLQLRRLSWFHKLMFFKIILVSKVCRLLNRFIHQFIKNWRHSMQDIFRIDRIWFHNRKSVSRIIYYLQHFIVWNQ